MLNKSYTQICIEILKYILTTMTSRTPKNEPIEKCVSAQPFRRADTFFSPPMSFKTLPKSHVRLLELTPRYLSEISKSSICIEYVLSGGEV
jgi:hypothetical protein